MLGVGQSASKEKLLKSESKVVEKESKHESNVAIVNQESNLDPMVEETDPLDKIDSTLGGVPE